MPARDSRLDRRDFMKRGGQVTATAAAALMGANAVHGAVPDDKKITFTEALPTRKLGKTEVELPMLGCNSATTTTSLTRSSLGRGRRGIVAVTVQFLLVLILAGTVVGVLHLDSRLYFGVDVNGQPLHQEVNRPPERQPGFKPFVAETARDRHSIPSAPVNESPCSEVMTPGPEDVSRSISGTDS